MPANRRRRRSVRTVVSALLLAVAGFVVVAALVSGEPLWVGFAACLALGAGATAARILSTELVQSRRDHAHDRAVQAQAYNEVFAERAREHAQFATAMARRIADRDITIGRLRGDLRRTERSADELRVRVRLETERADTAEEKVRELSTALVEQAAGPDPWRADLEPTVVDLMAWEERNIDTGSATRPAQRRRAGPPAPERRWFAHADTAPRPPSVS